MSFKYIIMNSITTHPKLVILGISIAVTFVIGISTGSRIEGPHQAFADNTWI